MQPKNRCTRIVEVTTVDLPERGLDTKGAKMRKVISIFILTFILACSNSNPGCIGFARGFTQEELRTVTLFPPRDKNTGKYDETRACFSFKSAGNKLPNSKDWDLGYGFLQISYEDWFMVGMISPRKRSVIKDLGEHNWSDVIKIPVLEPLPELKEGEQRRITVDSSAGTHKDWAKQTQLFAKVIIGHMYLMRVKDDDTDIYAMFRVDELAQNKLCTISWKIVDPSK